MTSLLQQFQDALQQSQQSSQSGGKKRRPVRKPVRAATKPKAKPKRLVNKRALRNKLMRQLGGFFEDIANFTNDSSDGKTMTKEEKAKYTNNPPNSIKERMESIPGVQMAVNAVPTSVVPVVVGGARRYKKVTPKKAAPKKRPVVRKYRFSGGYEEDDVEEFVETGDASTANSSIPVSIGGRMHRRSPARRVPVRRVPVRRVPVRRTRSPHSRWA